MKLNKISAFIFLISSFSLYSMEELADGKERNNLVKPHINPAAGVFETDEYSSSDEEEDDDGTFDFLEETVEDDIPEKLLSEKETIAQHTFNNLHLYANDSTYQDIPVKQRGKFMQRECALNNDPKSFYRKFEIYNIQSAKKRYDLIKKHDRERRNAKIKGVVGATVAGVLSIAALGTIGFLGKSLFDANNDNEELFSLIEQSTKLVKEVCEDAAESRALAKEATDIAYQAVELLIEKAKKEGLENYSQTALDAFAEFAKLK